MIKSITKPLVNKKIKTKLPNELSAPKSTLIGAPVAPEPIITLPPINSAEQLIENKVAPPIFKPDKISKTSKSPPREKNKINNPVAPKSAVNPNKVLAPLAPLASLAPLENLANLENKLPPSKKSSKPPNPHFRHKVKNKNNGNKRLQAKKSKNILQSIEPYVNPSHKHNHNHSHRHSNQALGTHSGLPLPNKEFIDTNTYQLFTDGSHMMEYNKAGIGGYLLSPHGVVVMEFSETIKDDTMLAKHEIMALEKGLLEASRLGVANLICYTDLQKMAEVLNIRNPTMRAGYVQTNPALERVNILLRRFEKISFKYIPREQNKKADRLSRQMLLKETDNVSRLVEHSINIKNLYCVQKYTREERDKFLDLKKDIRYFLAFNIEQREETFYIQTYKASQKNYKYVSSFVAELKLSKNWIPQAITHISKMLIECEEVFKLEKDFDKRQIIVAIKEKKEIINYLLRGLAPITAVSQKAIEDVHKACQRWSKVVVHYEGVLMDGLFEKSSRHCGAVSVNKINKKNKPNKPNKLNINKKKDSFNTQPKISPPIKKVAKKVKSLSNDALPKLE